METKLEKISFGSFIVVIIVSSIALAGWIQQLEQRVELRTHELEGKNAELARMNKLLVGRELHMIELKKKIKDLETKHKKIEL